MTKIAIAPPTQEQLDKLRQNLRRCLHLEHAAVLAGIPTKVLTPWIVAGRQGARDFQEFINIVDGETAKSAAAIVDMNTQAMSDGDLSAARWIYEKMYAQRNKAMTQKWIELEDMAEADASTGPTAEEIAAAEARALGEDLQ